MNNYSLKAILLEDCYYSQNAFNLLNKYNINADILWIKQKDKEKYKTDLIKTFPQIYFKKNNKFGDLLLGGFDNLDYFIKTFLNKKLNNNKINEWINKTGWTKKITLRLIELINQK
jgi:hypothetical protein